MSIRFYYFCEVTLRVEESISFETEKKYNEGNFLNQTTMKSSPRYCEFYCILHGWRKESAAVCVMTQQHRQNNNIAEAIVHKLIQYNK